MPEWLSIFLSPDLWESLTGPLWLTGNGVSRCMPWFPFPSPFGSLGSRTFSRNSWGL